MASVRRKLWTILCTSVLAAGCRDAVAPEAHQSTVPSPATRPALARLECSVEMSSAQLSCRETGPAERPNGPSFAILGQGYIKMRNDAFVTDTVTRVSHTNVTVQNLLPEPIGTPDGITLTSVKVFYEKYPVAASYYTPGDTGTVTARNADGVATFTRPGQTYYQYDEILVPNDTSAPKRWEWNVPRTVKSFSFIVLVSADVPSEARVPSLAPAGVPDWVYADSMVLTDTGRIAVPIRKDIVMVMFAPGTPQPKRRAAVDTVGGTVVGGRRLTHGDGFYYLRIPGNGTAGPVLDAITRLRARAEVKVAVEEFILPMVASVRPDDGADFRHWKLSPEGADGRNWGLEAIAAPLAWGCSRGDTSSVIAILDTDFHDAGDITTNADPVYGQPRFNALTRATDTVDHGTKVSSIIGARGDNGTGVTGVMYAGRIRLYESSVDFQGNVQRDSVTNVPDMINLQTALDQAIYEAPPVVNVSLGIQWSLIKSGAPGTAADHQLITDLTHAIVGTIQLALGQNPNSKPLFVVAAGNDGLAPYWSAFPNIANTFAGQTLVVAGAENSAGGGQRFTLDPTSNLGAPVEIAAPGRDVYALNRTGDASPVPARGTSFAAPHVSGTAGLLVSFDPRLKNKPDSLKQLILRGARRGGRTAGGYPMLNAYEALKVAAERRTAPLCGNPVYRDTTGQVFARRDSAWTHAELLFTTPDTLVEVLHGGKRIRLIGGGGYTWSEGPGAHWQTAGTVGDTIANATNRSKRRMSHGMPLTTAADSLVSVTVTKLSPTQERFTVSVNGQPIGFVDGPLVQRAQNRSSECIEWDINGTPTTSCYAHWTTYQDSLVSNHTVSYSPSGDTIVVAISRDKFDSYVSTIIPLGTTSVRRHGQERHSLATDLYFLPIQGGSIRGPVQHTYRVETLGLSEDGLHLVAQTREKYLFSTIDTGSTVDQLNKCRATYLRSDGTALFSTAPRNLGLFGSVAVCYPGATFAP